VLWAPSMPASPRPLQNVVPDSIKESILNVVSRYGKVKLVLQLNRFASLPS